MCIGPWVTALQDSDRQVARAAADSFEGVFDTEKKRKIVWEKYGDDVFKYVSEVLHNETAKTISWSASRGSLTVGDERFVSAEDMDSRFALVAGMCLSGAAHLIGIV